MCNIFIVMWKDFIGIPLIFSKNQSIQLTPTYLFKNHFRLTLMRSLDMDAYNQSWYKIIMAKVRCL